MFVQVPMPRLTHEPYRLALLRRCLQTEVRIRSGHVIA